MRITYDKDADALYIRLLEGEFQCRTVRLTDDIAVDFALGEKLIGIEILGASLLFKEPDIPEIDIKNLIPVVVTGK